MARQEGKLGIVAKGFTSLARQLIDYNGGGEFVQSVRKRLKYKDKYRGKKTSRKHVRTTKQK